MNLLSYEKSCDTKAGWYPRICDAIHHADLLMDQITLMEHPTRAYWCEKHRVYHVGRNRFMKPEVRSVYEPAAWSRGREMRLGGMMEALQGARSFPGLSSYLGASTI